MGAISCLLVDGDSVRKKNAGTYTQYAEFAYVGNL